MRCEVGGRVWELYGWRNKLKLGCRLALRVGEYGLLHKTTIKLLDELLKR